MCGGEDPTCGNEGTAAAFYGEGDNVRAEIVGGNGAAYDSLLILLDGKFDGAGCRETVGK